MKSENDTKIQRAIDMLKAQPDLSRASLLRVCEQVPCSERWAYEARDRLLLRVQKASEEYLFLKYLHSDLQWMSEIIIQAGIPKGFTSVERKYWDDLVERYEELEVKLKEMEGNGHT